MLFLVARQREAPMKSLNGNYVTGFLWSVPWPLLCNNSVNKHNNGATLFPWGLCRGVILKTIGATVQFAVGYRHGKFSAGDRHGQCSRQGPDTGSSREETVTGSSRQETDTDSVLGRDPTRAVLGRRPTREVLM
jgi:hypothetical protein